jgi:hypothetical protein
MAQTRARTRSGGPQCPSVPRSDAAIDRGTESSDPRPVSQRSPSVWVSWGCLDGEPSRLGSSCGPLECAITVIMSVD